jgi:hypothetical protein
MLLNSELRLPMYAQLKSRIAELLAKPRPMKPQMERQIGQYLQEHSLEMPAFFQQAASLLEDHELEVLFAPQFTPALEDLAAVADLLTEWRPQADDLKRIVAELSTAKGNAVVQLPDGSEAPLPLHEVMVERFVKLLRLDHAPEPAQVTPLQDALPTELYTIAAALMRQRGFTPERQAWFSAFVRHVARKGPVTPALLSAAAQFISTQTTLERAALQAAAKELAVAAKSAVDYAQAGRMYWSPDVAQHHQYRGEGRVDGPLVQQRMEELTAIEALAAALQTFER